MRSTYLLDVNVLIALAWPNHVHHTSARVWFRATGHTAWATTPITESGFVRVSSNPAAVSEAVTPTEALRLLERMRSRPGHAFISDDVELVVNDALPADRVVTHRQVTDAHLLAVAARNNLRLATFDRALAKVARTADVALISVGVT